MDDKDKQYPLCHCNKHHNINESLLGCCRYCTKPITYNLYGYPECKHCDYSEVGAVCYHCGAADQPVYAEVGFGKNKSCGTGFVLLVGSLASMCTIATRPIRQ